MKKPKPVHLILLNFACTCKAVCNRYNRVIPIESTIRDSLWYKSKGTFNPKKVTCKRCLKKPLYKEALDKVNNPLFYWRENAV